MSTNSIVYNGLIKLPSHSKTPKKIAKIVFGKGLPLQRLGENVDARAQIMNKNVKL